MYSKVTIFGHPLHPMLIAFPVAFYTGTLVGFAVYAANGDEFWLKLAIALGIAGAGMAILAALPGLTDVVFGIPRGSKATLVGLTHGGLNVAALGLFIATDVLYVWHWNGPAVSPVLGLALSAAGVLITVTAGALGWMLVQTYHVGIQLTRVQEQDEVIVQQHVPTLTAVPHRRAS